MIQVLTLNGNQSWNVILGGGTGFLSRDSLVIGTYKPDASNTGIYPGTTLTPQTSDITYSTKQTISNMDFQCSVFLTAGAANSTFINCLFRSNGVDNSGSPGTITGPSQNLLGATFIDCTFDLTGRESAWIHCIQGSNFTLKRCHLTRGHDGVGLVSAGGNVNILGCWIHNSYVDGWAAGDPTEPSFSDNRTHNDCIQFHRGGNYVVRGNFLGGLRKYYVKDGSPSSISIPDSADDFDNSCILIQQEVDNTPANHMHDVLIEKNWFQGGAASINIGYKNGNPLTDNIVIQNNRFIRRISPGGGFYIYQNSAATPTLINNVFDDDGTPATVTLN